MKITNFHMWVKDVSFWKLLKTEDLKTPVKNEKKMKTTSCARCPKDHLTICIASWFNECLYLSLDLGQPITQMTAYIEGPAAGISFLTDSFTMTEIKTDSLWKLEAQSRIQQIRKGDLNINVASSTAQNDISIKVIIIQAEMTDALFLSDWHDNSHFQGVSDTIHCSCLLSHEESTTLHMPKLLEFFYLVFLFIILCYAGVIASIQIVSCLLLHRFIVEKMVPYIILFWLITL